MVLDIPKEDARTARVGGIYLKVTDAETKKVVGHLDITKRTSLDHPTTRALSLFGGKYKGEFNSHEECVAFARGVEAVLNHVVSTGDQD